MPAGPAKKRKAGAWPPRSRGYKVFRVVNAIILILVVLAVLLTFLNLLAQSFSSETYITREQRQPVAEGLQPSPRTST